ncbi:thymidylate kinase [Mycobacterium phage JacoRen57]|nr:thymidylate kinase [Mycobacterium phage JacoRen57]
MSIILEGPDGAGKTTLLQELQGHFPNMEQHPRFSTSLGGPIENLAEAVYKDTVSRPTHFLYDRHPVISEYVYTFATGRPIRAAFLEDSMARVRSRVARHSLVIWCLPPFREVHRNVLRDNEQQMDGVVANIRTIYDMYRMQRIMWPGRSVTFDYTNPGTSWEVLRYALSDTVNKLWKEQP